MSILCIIPVQLNLMRVLFTVLLVTSVAAGIYFFVFAPKAELERAATVTETSPESGENAQPPREPATITSRSVFVPYWADMSSLAGASDESAADENNSASERRLLYFGISVNENGVVEDDAGYLTLDSFISNAGSAEKYLTVRMLDAELNTAILKNSNSWQPIATSIAELAIAKGFDGVVLDLEVGLVAFHIAPAQITGFTQALNEELQSNDLSLAMTMYGDTFYRKRPYDVKALGNIVDEMMIMAYDFHKSFGTPGPNFPLNGRAEYGYDFTTMISDFTSLVEPGKLSIIFGMYGYEWTVDEQERPSTAGTAITLNQIEQKFYPQCSFSNCNTTQDQQSGETKISYTAADGRTHIVWFEDESSVELKKNIVEEYGVSKIGYWAFGYY